MAHDTIPKEVRDERNARRRAAKMAEYATRIRHLQECLEPQERLSVWLAISVGYCRICGSKLDADGDCPSAHLHHE